jgi:pyrroline-5-carboxylate reductase
MKYELGVIGAGNMAQAIVAGVLRGGVFKADQILAAGRNAKRLEEFGRALGVPTTADNRAVASGSRIVLLSVKPAGMGEMLREIAPVVDPRSVFVSVAAGISVRFIESSLRGDHPWRVIRTMPNTPMQVGAGAVGLARGSHATDDDVAAVRRIFESCATVVDVAEDQLDAVTAVSGSGPAYFFFLVEQMIATGVELGLSADQARQLAAQTALGAGAMLTQNPLPNPAELRQRVTSPGGTTNAAITSLRSAGFEDAVRQAMKACAQRARELGQ